MSTDKSYSSIADLLKESTAPKGLYDKFRARAIATTLLKQLVLLRQRAGKTQKEIAAKMEISQSRISKIESATDDSLTIGYLKKYADIAGYNLVITFVPKTAKAVDQVMYHASEIERNLAKLTQIANKGDDSIAQGIGNFFGSAAYNLAKIVDRQAAKLPKQQAFRVDVIEQKEDQPQINTQRSASSGKAELITCT